MLDVNLKIEKREARSFAPLPENIYQVELLDITSEEVETYDSKKGNTETQEFETVLSFQFTLLSGKDGDEDLRGRNVWVNFVPTYLYIGKNGKNNLYRVVEALLGRELTQKEEAEGLSGAFLNDLVGKQCRVGTKHKKSGDKIFDRVESFYPSENDLTPLTDKEKESAQVKSTNEKTDEDIPEFTADDIGF